MPNYKKVNAGGSKLVTNCETRNDRKFDKVMRGFTAVTKPAVWVQFTVKKNRVDDKNLLHLKYLTCQKLQLFFSVLRKISVHIMSKVIILNKKNLEKIWKLIQMVSHQKNKSGTKCWLTCLFNNFI